MEKKRYFMGVDVAKKTLAVSVYDAETNGSVYHAEIENSVKGLRGLFKKLAKLPDFCAANLLACWESTGIYGAHLAKETAVRKIDAVEEDALQIKLSSGRSRGKSDPADAKKIAEYAYLHRTKLRLRQPQDAKQTELKRLLSARRLLLKQQTSLNRQFRDLQDFDNQSSKNIQAAFKKTLKAMADDLKALDKKIQALIDETPEMKKNFDLLVSVKGIGRVTAWYFIDSTRNFTRFDNAKQLACYAGVVPHPNESGSKKGARRVSQMANHALKSVLHMAALSALRYNRELKNYFERKVKEGKNKMSVVNAIRNKLVLTLWSVVKRGTAWVEKREPEAQKNPAIA